MQTPALCIIRAGPCPLDMPGADLEARCYLHLRLIPGATCTGLSAGALFAENEALWVGPAEFPQLIPIVNTEAREGLVFFVSDVLERVLAFGSAKNANEELCHIVFHSISGDLHYVWVIFYISCTQVMVWFRSPIHHKISKSFLTNCIKGDNEQVVLKSAALK